jgi:hypothetical protein
MVSSRRALPVLLAGLCLVTAGACRRPADETPPPLSRPNPTATAPDAAPTTAETPSPDRRVALTVNGNPLFEREIDAAAAREGCSRSEALKLTVQAEVVAAEARANAFPGAAGAERFTLARDYLDQVFSSQTLCARITPAQIRQFYELTYRPEWPVDVFRGELLEIRCCERLTDPCDPAEVDACFARHAPLLDALRPVAEAWRQGTPPPLDELRPTWPALRLTDFGILAWPGIPVERRRPRELFDEATVDAVRQLAPGDVAGPLRSPLGIHLFRLTEHRGAIQPDSPEFAETARTELCRRRIDETRRDYVKRLVEAAVIVREGEQELRR